MCLWRCSGREYLFRQSAHWYRLVLAAWPLAGVLEAAPATELPPVVEGALGELAGVATGVGWEAPDAAGETPGGAGYV